MRRGDAVGELQPAHDVEKHEIKADGAKDRQPGEPEEQRTMVAHRFEQGRMRRLLFHRHGRQASAQEIADQTDQQAEDERNAPGPLLDGVGRQGIGDQRAGHGSQEDSAAASDFGETAGESAPSGRRQLEKKDPRSRAFAADREALHHAQQRQDDRRGEPQGLVAGQDADQKRRYRHRRHGKGERDLAAELVADVPDHATAQWAHDVAHGEDAEGRQDLRDFILGGKVRATDLGGEVAVDGKVVPFEHVADDASCDVARRT